MIRDSAEGTWTILTGASECVVVHSHRSSQPSELVRDRQLLIISVFSARSLRGSKFAFSTQESDSLWAA